MILVGQHLKIPKVHYYKVLLDIVMNRGILEWYIRYVEENSARFIMKENITLEEYMGKQ